MSINNPNDTLGGKVNEMTDGRDDPNKGPFDRAENALTGHDDPNRGPLDRAANAATGSSGGIAGATSDTSMQYTTGGSTGGKATAVFDSQEEAQRAVEQLRAEGIDDSNLSLIAQSGRTTTTTAGDGEIVDEDHSSVLRGVLGGGALGAGLGIAALAIPGVGPLVAAGAIATSAIPGAAALGAAIGATAGTLNEVLSSHGVDDDDATYYGDRIQGGGVFVSVDTSQSDVAPSRVQEILYDAGGHSATSPKAM